MMVQKIVQIHPKR